ncbi:cellulase family glycosylhydrolase [Azospirillum thermophilum]|uniref:cellulase n=1 Tax=Azospirillum thermophilum TaxID=2202148 RepID=A0A2S2CWF2_9PROT|nr:carbohydrate-binding domain-containing protein [Azospirillum thermophilum]AWK88854.1 endoglucanase [Azospirillum thermophilum]
MATNPVDTTFVVNASGLAAGGVWPHFKLLVDGTVVGQATVNSTNAGRYTFKTKVAPDAAHKIQIVYDNDWLSTDKAGMYRDLLVKSIEVNGKTIASNSSVVSYDADGQGVLSGREQLSWGGSLDFALTKSYFPAPSGSGSTPVPTTPPAGSTAIVVNASGTVAGGSNAHFKVLVDGKVIGEATAATSSKDFTFHANVAQDQAHKVQIQFDNDATINGQDRNLTVNKITIGGHSVLPTDGIVSYDKGALDGRDVVAGKATMNWNGTLVVNADKSFFSHDTSPTPTNPPATTPKISVNDVTVTEPKAGGGGASGIVGFLHTEGNQIVDAAGNNVRLNGVNWFGGEGYNYVPTGLWADSYQGHINKMKDIGFNVIRLTYADEMFESSAVTNGIDYSKNPDLQGLTRLQVYDKIIDYAGKVGMKVILDHHRNDGGAGTNEHGLWYSQKYPESKMIENWKMLAKHYAGNTTVIGADLHNEPSVSATWGGNPATDWAAAAERIGNAIQTVNKDWLMFVEGTEWSSTLAGVKNNPVEFNVPNKLVYSPHVYGQSVYNFPWLQDPSYPKNLPAQYDGMWGYIYKNNIAPVLIGEFGGKFETAAERTWVNALMKYTNGDWNLDGKADIAAGDKGMSWTYWAWTPESHDVGGLLNSDFKTVNQAKVDLIKTGMAGVTHGTGSGGTATTNAVFTVKLSGASDKPVTVEYNTVDGTAKAGSDYVATSGKLTFAAGETVKTVAVKVLSDSISEGTETFSLKLANATSASISDASGTGTIQQGSSASTAELAHTAELNEWTNAVTSQQHAATTATTATAAELASAGSAAQDAGAYAHANDAAATADHVYHDPSLLHAA